MTNLDGPPRATPDVDITLHGPDGPRDLTLSYPLPQEHAELLRSLHAGGNDKGVIECRMHDGDPRLSQHADDTGRVRGAWLYLAINPHAQASGAFELKLCHWPRGIASGSHAVAGAMSPEHRAQQEYVADRGRDFGYSAYTEHSLARGTRSDVVIVGQRTMTGEIQLSGASSAGVRRRDTAVRNVGADPVWFGPDRPGWAPYVAHALTNPREGMAARTWTVASGVRVIEREKCTASSAHPCPTSRNWCGGWHSRFVPAGGFTVDDIVEQVPAGGLVRFDTGTKQGVVLTAPNDRDSWIGEYGDPRAPVRRPQSSRSSEWAGVRHNAAYLPMIVAAETPEERAVLAPGVCANCRVRPKAGKFPTCTPCFFFPARFAVAPLAEEG